MSEKKEYHKKTKLPLIIALATVLIALIVIMVVLVVQSVSPEKWVQKQLETGARYLFQMDYEQAIASYRAAIEIDPKSEEAYLGLAEAYVGMGEYEYAVEVLTDGYECTNDEVILESLADVYLKWPESMLGKGIRSDTDVARALEILQDGYELTGDKRMVERIAELTKSVEEEQDLSDLPGLVIHEIEIQDSIKERLDNNVVVSIDGNYCIVKYEKRDVKVRQFPPGGSEVAIVNGGDLFSVQSSIDCSDGYTWYQISGVVDGCTINGYICADCVNYNPYVVIKDGKSVKIRELPVSGAEVAVASSGEKLHFIGSEEGKDGYTWYHVMGEQSDKTYTGYVRADFAEYYDDGIPYVNSSSNDTQSTYVMGSLNNDPYVVIKDGKSVKIRALPVNGSEVAVANSGDKLQVIGSKEGEDGYTWYHVMGEQFDSTYTGYVRADCVDYYGEIIPYDSLNSNENQSTYVMGSLTPLDPPDNAKPYGNINDFYITKIRLNEKEVSAYTNDILYIMYAYSPEGNTGWYLYDSVEGRWIRYADILRRCVFVSNPDQLQYRNVKISGTIDYDDSLSSDNNNYGIINPALNGQNEVELPVLPGDFYEVIIRVGNREFYAWTNDTFYLFFASSPEGNTGWYLLDSFEGRWIRFLFDFS